MVVCHCFAVSDRAVRAAIRAGADSVEALTQRCAAGSDCGGCRPVLEELLEEHRRGTADAPFRHRGAAVLTA
jgi:bacterioferritin-associated ferredoxin